MSESNDGILELFVGDDWSIPFTLRSKNTLKPLDLTGVTELSIAFRNADGTTLTKTLSAYVSGSGITITSATGGSGLIEVPKAETALIRKGERLNHTMVMTKAGKETSAAFPANMTFKAR